MLELGQSSQHSIFDCSSSPTLTTSTYPPECSSDERVAAKTADAVRGESCTLWSRALNLLHYHLPKQTSKGETGSALAPIVSSTHSVQVHNAGAHAPQDLVVRSCMRDTSSRYRRNCSRLVVKQFPTGYPNLAAFADSDESFMLYRRFGYLQSRVLLDKQDELRLLEAQLDALDRSEMYNEPDNLFTRECQGEQRKKLLSSIEILFCEYGTSSIASLVYKR